MPISSHGSGLFATEFFVFAITGDGETEEQNPGGMQDMFRFIKVEDQHQRYTCHTNSQTKKYSVQSFFKSIRIFKLFSNFWS